MSSRFSSLMHSHSPASHHSARPSNRTIQPVDLSKPRPFTNPPSPLTFFACLLHSIPSSLSTINGFRKHIRISRTHQLIAQSSLLHNLT